MSNSLDYKSQGAFSSTVSVMNLSDKGHIIYPSANITQSVLITVVKSQMPINIYSFILILLI